MDLGSVPTDETAQLRLANVADQRAELASRLTGFGLLSYQTWARVAGVVLVTVNMLEHMALVGAYPWWSATTIIVSVFILYALIVPKDDYVLA